MYRSILLPAAVAAMFCGWLDAREPVLDLAYPALTFDDNATAAAVVPDGSGRVVVALQRGQIRVLPQDRNAAEAVMFLDLREKLKEETEFEEGLHGLAFHPQFKTSRKLYLCYTQRGPRRTVLSEVMVPEVGDFRGDLRTERVLLEYPHPLANHWGGGLAFGPDGYLYVGIGDGGLRDDPYRLGQNLWSLHGKILRLDVDGRSAGLAYRIPADNPFADRQEVRGEIWALGFRNPWGMAFDRKTGHLWCADVGQDKWEEVNVIRRGGNYGWSERDGPERLAAKEALPAEKGPFVDPVHSYPHLEGISVTGGFVYRGKRVPSLQGRYLFGDWGMGKLWSLSRDGKTGRAADVKLLFEKDKDNHPGFNPTAITRDARGEPLIFSHYPSVIYTLRDPESLANADETDEDEPELISPGEEPTVPEVGGDEPLPI